MESHHGAMLAHNGAVEGQLACGWRFDITLMGSQMQVKSLIPIRIKAESPILIRNTAPEVEDALIAGSHT